jgi:chromate transport protein ChrA
VTYFLRLGLLGFGGPVALVGQMFGDLSPVTAIFYGVSPAVIALILHSC